MSFYASVQSKVYFFDTDCFSKAKQGLCENYNKKRH